MNNNQIKYVISDSTLTFYSKDEIRMVHKSQALIFEAVRNALLNLPGGENHLALVLENPKDFLLESFKSRQNVLGLKISERVEEIEASGMPLEPYLRFIHRCPTDFITSNPKVLTQVGTVDLPLTWEGDLVGYQRASWVYSSNSFTPWVDEENFVPYKTVANSNRPLQFGNFHWVQSACPDTGMTYEVVVQPEHLVNAFSHYKGEKHKLLQATQLVLLSRLGKEVQNESISLTSIVDIQTANSDLGPIAVRLPYNAGTTVKMLESLFNSSLSTQQLNKMATTQILVGVGGC